MLDLAALCETGVKAVAAAAVITESVRLKEAVTSLSKSDNSPVTVADFAAQAVLVLQLWGAVPQVRQVVAEECADELRCNSTLAEKVVACVRKCPGLETVDTAAILDAIDAGGRAEPPGPTTDSGSRFRYFWCIDPVDGTKGFLRNDQYAVCLGLVEVDQSGRGTAVLGVLGCPNLPSSDPSCRGAIFFGAKGVGAFELPIANISSKTGKYLDSATPIRVSRTEKTTDVVCVESVESSHTLHNANLSICEALGITHPPLRMDSQCKYALVARGEAGLYLRTTNYSGNIWDHAAGAAIVAEAGGSVTDDRGNQLDFGAGRRLIANANSLLISEGGLLHTKVVQLMKRC